MSWTPSVARSLWAFPRRSTRHRRPPITATAPRPSQGGPIASEARPSVRRPCRSPCPSTSAPGSTSSTPSSARPRRIPAGPLLILAGAGTGKTTTLCARVAWLVSEGVAPERILLLTFTRRAAREMLQRARALVPMPAGAGGVVGGTFHSVGAPLPAPARRGARTCRPASACSTRATPPTCSTSCGRSTATPSRARRFPRKGTLLDIYSRTVNAQQPLSGVRGRALPVVRGARRGDRGAVQGLHRAQARARRARPRRPAAVLARARARRGDRARASRRRSTTCWSTSTRTSTGCRSTSCARCARHGAASPWSATTSRRSTASAPRRPSTSSTSPSTSPTRRS